ncbi:hypothetical protein LTR37_005460 [Vermiconidia calcicola]|uniref:Uncharacterized protein n=1 Tax=Vermiconidia calcicola TaxID=1690605 RepID=A0ACC3NKD1_9PEZI|nr:hypothetical protein LTR37_005460 [Vermiconidia calcicola]
MDPTLEEQMQDFLVSKLRESYPYMKTRTSDIIVERCKALLGKEVDAQNKSRISFLSLSAELRNRIYALVLSPEEEGEGGAPGSTAICVNGLRDECDEWDGYIYTFGEVTSWAKQPSLTRVSHRIRLESLPVYYGNNRFIVYPAGWDEGDRYVRLGPYPTAISWLKSIGKHNAALLNDIQIRFRGCNFKDWIPAKRFIGITQQHGIELSQACIKGYVADRRIAVPEAQRVWGEEHKWVQIWGEVDEGQDDYHKEDDELGVNLAAPEFVNDSWEPLKYTRTRYV